MRSVLYDAFAIYFLIFFIKTYVMGTRLNCLDLSTYVSIKKQIEVH